MKKIRKYNEFVDNDEILIIKLIEEAECTNKADLYRISETTSYKKVIEMGEFAIPFLLKRINEGPAAIWNIALSKITGVEYDKWNVDNLNFYHVNGSEVKDFWKNWAEKNGF